MKDIKVATKVDLLTNKQINKSTLVRIPTRLHRKIKIDTASRGISITYFLITVIEEYFKKITTKATQS